MTSGTYADKMVILFAIVWWGQSVHFPVSNTQNRRVGCARDQAFIWQCAIDQFPNKQASCVLEIKLHVPLAI
jgi:hypothetical protein